MKKYLIGYVSKTGTTKEIAEKIGSIFVKNGVHADVLPLDEIKDVNGYTGVILGAPINGMKLVPQIKQFAEKNKKAGRVIGIFAVSYMFERGRNMWTKSIRKDVERFARLLNCTSSTIFNGRIAKKMPGFANFIFGIPKDLPLDNRNWVKIEQWAQDIIKKI